MIAFVKPSSMPLGLALRGFASRHVLLALHLAVLCLVSAIAFRHNIEGLFFSYDGAYMVLLVQAQQGSQQGLLELWSDFGQSIGSIQSAVNARLFPFCWPLFWIGDLETAMIAVYLATTIAVFVATYLVARFISATRGTALLAGWALCLLMMPLVPQPVLFYHLLLWSDPQAVIMIVVPVIVFALVRPIGRRGLLVDGLCGIGLLALATYLLVACPIGLPLIMPASATFIVAALCLSTGRREFNRKVLVLLAIVAAAIALRWPWYLLGYFAYSAAYLYPNDFVSPYSHPIFISLLFDFQGKAIGWAGLLLAYLALVGALLSCRSDDRRLRYGALIVLGIMALALALCIALAFVTVFPLPPIYMEVGFWPLYAAYAALAAVRCLTGASRLLSRFNSRAPRLGSGAALVVLLLAAFGLASVGSRVDGQWPIPPSLPPIVETLAAHTAIRNGAPFEGRVATVVPLKSEGDPWVQQRNGMLRLAIASGNDHFSTGLWWYRIPTLLEYNQFSSPAMHALRKAVLEPSFRPHYRNVSVYTRPNPRIFELLGVRYLIVPATLGQTGTTLQTETIANETWRLEELPAPNLGTYTPTIIEHAPSISQMIERVTAADFDPATRAVAAVDLGQPLVPAKEIALHFSGGDVRVTGTSSGRTLVVIPREYSHCLELIPNGPATASLHRVDGALTGVLFDRTVDAVVAFRTGPFHNPTCRYEDFRDFVGRDGAFQH
jgi:hypothetical protein